MTEPITTEEWRTTAERMCDELIAQYRACEEYGAIPASHEAAFKRIFKAYMKDRDDERAFHYGKSPKPGT